MIEISKMRLPGIDRILEWPLVGPIVRHRFFKFGIVGLLGTCINLGSITINQEILFRGIHPEERRLYFSLGAAIFLATLHNFLWNRHWTWGDRKGKTGHGFFVQMSQYYVACGVAIGVQFVFTILLSKFIHYLIANAISIVISAIVNYLLNDIWTFALKAIPHSLDLKRPSENQGFPDSVWKKTTNGRGSCETARKNDGI